MVSKDELYSRAVSAAASEYCDIVYLVKFGSHLYGTDTENSDTDVKGVFMPSEDDMLLGKHTKNISCSTGKQTSKNSKDDIDISLWSVQYWIELLKKGDTNAIDLLYSFTNEDCIIYSTPYFLSFVKEHHRDFYNPKKLYGYIGYISGQAKKYGMRGTRVGVLKTVIDRLNRVDNVSDSERLQQIVPWILKECGHDSLCFAKDLDKGRALVLLGKAHMYSIKISEFRSRMQQEWETYGERARLAEMNEGIDWKAVSHAFRAAFQMKELFNTGKITFPLKGAPFLKRVKNGEISWNECEELLAAHKKDIEDLREGMTYTKRNELLIDEFVLSFYYNHRS